MWGRRRNGLTNNFTPAVYVQFLVAADRRRVSLGYLSAGPRYTTSKRVLATKSRYACKINDRSLAIGLITKEILTDRSMLRKYF